MTEVVYVKHQAQRRGFKKGNYYFEVWVFPYKSHYWMKRKQKQTKQKAFCSAASLNPGTWLFWKINFL